MNVFLTGASGYIGTAVARALGEAGHRVSGLARSDQSAQKMEAAGIRPVRGALADADVITQAARGADAVIHAAAVLDGDTAARFVDAVLAGLDGAPRPFLFTAGLWDLGDTHGDVAAEDWPPHPPALIAWRPALSDRVRRESARGVVLRPGIVYGGGSLAGMAAEARQSGVVRYVGDGAQCWTTVYVRDLADLYVRALESAPAGALYHACNEEAVPLRDLAQADSEAAGLPGQVQPWPLEQAQAELGPMADALALDQRATARKARETLGWAPQSPSPSAEMSDESALH